VSPHEAGVQASIQAGRQAGIRAGSQVFGDQAVHHLGTDAVTDNRFVVGPFDTHHRLLAWRTQTVGDGDVSVDAPPVQFGENGVHRFPCTCLEAAIPHPNDEPDRGPGPDLETGPGIAAKPPQVIKTLESWHDFLSFLKPGRFPGLNPTGRES
jgi:hypothetical protein